MDGGLKKREKRKEEDEIPGEIRNGLAGRNKKINNEQQTCLGDWDSATRREEVQDVRFLGTTSRSAGLSFGQTHISLYLLSAE